VTIHPAVAACRLRAAGHLDAAEARFVKDGCGVTAIQYELIAADIAVQLMAANLATTFNRVVNAVR
jgi:Flp pilus assembly pilin Flp